MERNENGLTILFPGANEGANERAGCAARQLAMVYSPMQCWRMLYAHDDALMRGTLFEELYKPLEEDM